jgi:hypothetical protein
MTQLDPQIETCSCLVCRSDAAYIIPCLANDPAGVPEPVAENEPAVVEVFPIPLLM